VTGSNSVVVGYRCCSVRENYALQSEARVVKIFSNVNSAWRNGIVCSYPTTDLAAYNF
jgi:hypothetical protein